MIIFEVIGSVYFLVEVDFSIFIGFVGSLFVFIYMLIDVMGWIGVLNGLFK